MLACLLAGCCDREADRKALDQQEGFACQEGNQVRYEAWSECGLMKVCINPRTEEKDGSQFAAQEGYVQSKSLYSKGKRVGGLTWLDADGNAYEEDGGYRMPNP